MYFPVTLIKYWIFWYLCTLFLFTFFGQCSSDGSLPCSAEASKENLKREGLNRGEGGGAFSNVVGASHTIFLPVLPFLSGSSIFVLLGLQIIMCCYEMSSYFSQFLVMPLLLPPLI